MRSSLIEVIVLSTAFFSSTSGYSWNYNFANCLSGNSQGNCTCPEGKVMARQSNRLLCFDRCDGCPNGFCGFLGTCNCFDGHEDAGTCAKICPNCDNGWCSSSEKCECNQGFTKSNRNKCEPVCDPRCSSHGYCSAPGVCSCRRRYQMSETNKCVPICLEGCPNNGYCYAPGRCKCNNRYRTYAFGHRRRSQYGRHHRFRTNVNRYNNNLRCIKSRF